MCGKRFWLHLSIPLLLLLLLRTDLSTAEDETNKYPIGRVIRQIFYEHPSPEDSKEDTPCPECHPSQPPSSSGNGTESERLKRSFGKFRRRPVHIVKLHRGNFPRKYPMRQYGRSRYRVMPAMRLSNFIPSTRMYGRGYSPYIPHAGAFRVMPAKRLPGFMPSPQYQNNNNIRPHNNIIRPPPTFHESNSLSGEIVGRRPPHPPPPPPPVHFLGGNAGRGKGGCNCVHLVECPAVVHQEAFHGCSLPNRADGVCCPGSSVSPPWGGITNLFNPEIPTVNIPPVSSEQLNVACHMGVDSVKNIQNVENMLMHSNNVLKKGTPERGHLKFFQVTRTARSIHKAAMAISKATEAMKQNFGLTNAQSCIGLRRYSARETILAENCPVPPQCNPHSKYRTFDGSCNNLQRGLWGKSETAFQRILPARYEDGIKAARVTSVTGGPLPNERRISDHVLIDFNNPDPKFTLSVMQFGQFVDHDMTHSPFSSFDNNEGKECCRDGKFVTPQLLEDCWPIEIPRDDEFYARRDQHCMNFVRSMLAEDSDCAFGCAEQMNQVTHWLDGSNIYGSTDEEAAKIHDLRTGLLKVSDGHLLPYQTEKSHDCEAPQGVTCYSAGDSRVNEQPGLIAIHTIWHREHNRVATALRAMNPHWSPAGVFHEARRIVIAEYQHITYNEWLPVVVGEPFMHSFDISPKRGGYNLDYSPTLNPNMNNEFATAAFRFGHTLVQGTMHVFSRSGEPSPLQLKEHFNSPNLFQQDPEMVDKFARTFSKQNGQSFDPFITRELTNHLFETKQTDFGMDLMSLNIHRGRDHGIVPYNEIRVICGLPRARTFNDLLDQMSEDTVRRMASVYRHVDDIDFFVGGISEKPVAGGLIGWTFLCVVGDQFARIKKGDRFFYDLGGQPGSFTPAQLNEVRKVSWSRILCDNSRMDQIQPLSFRLPSNSNPLRPCNSPSIPTVDLRHWRGEKAHI